MKCHGRLNFPGKAKMALIVFDEAKAAAARAIFNGDFLILAYVIECFLYTRKNDCWKSYIHS